MQLSHSARYEMPEPDALNAALGWHHHRRVTEAVTKELSCVEALIKSGPLLALKPDTPPAGETIEHQFRIAHRVGDGC
jgi:hypothetical protein